MDKDGNKQCTTCLETKQNAKGENFYKNPSAKDGYSTICKACRKLYNKGDAAYGANKPEPIPSPAAAPRPVIGAYEVPKSHSQEDIKHIEKQTGLKYAGTLVVGGKSRNTLEVQHGKTTKFVTEDIDTIYTTRVPVFKKAS
jgi:hypothetical protein